MDPQLMLWETILPPGDQDLPERLVVADALVASAFGADHRRGHPQSDHAIDDRRLRVIFVALCWTVIS
jgi:hypothetical protein